MNKNLLYYFFISITTIALCTSCKKEDKFPAQTLPDIIIVNPTTAIPGAPVTIRGKHLDAVTAIRFGVVKAVFNVTSDSSISAIVPDSIGSGSLYVQVYVGDGVAYEAQQFTILEAPKIPVIKNIDTSTASPGDNITISGINFTDVSAVLFGNVAAIYTISDSTKLNVTVPANLAATDRLITVASPSGSDTTSLNINLAPAIISFAPAAAKVNDVITVTGKRFTGTSSVKIGSASTVYNIIDDTSLTFTVPAGATSGNIIITTLKGSITSSTGLVVN